MHLTLGVEAEWTSGLTKNHGKLNQIQNTNRIPMQDVIQTHEQVNGSRMIQILKMSQDQL